MDNMAPNGEIYGHLMKQPVKLAKVTLENLPIIPQTDVPRWFKVGKTTASSSSNTRYIPSAAQLHMFWLPTREIPDNFENLIISFITYISEKDSQVYKIGKEWFYLNHDNPKRFLDSLVQCLYIVCTLPIRDFLSSTDETMNEWMQSYDWRENLHCLSQKFDETWGGQNYFQDTVFDCIIENYLEKEEEYDTFNLGMLRTEASFSEHGINMIKDEIQKFYLNHAGHYNKDEFSEYRIETNKIFKDRYVFDVEQPDGGMINEIQKLLDWSESEAHYKFISYLGGTYQTKHGVSMVVAKQAHGQLKKITDAINNLRVWSLKMAKEYISVFDIDIDEEEGKPYNTIYDIFREDKIWWSRREARRGNLREVTPEEEQKYYKIKKQIEKETQHEYWTNRNNA